MRLFFIPLYILTCVLNSSIVNCSKQTSDHGITQKYNNAYAETIQEIKLRIGDRSAGKSGCFGFDDTVDTMPLWCSKLNYLCTDEKLKSKVGKDNVKSLHDALEACGLTETEFNHYLSDECF